LIAGGVTGGSGGSGSCDSLWVCDEWLSCSGILRSRSCVDVNHCSTGQSAPLLMSCFDTIPDDVIEGCVLFQDLNVLIGGWKANVYRFDVINSAINHWKFDIDC